MVEYPYEKEKDDGSMSTYRCLQPEYVRLFQCDGTRCNAQCCRGWNIQLDKGALERFRNAPGELGREILSHVAVNEATGIPEIQKAGDACPMLGEDLLCSLQKRQGEGFLSDVCAEYPRLTTQFPDRLERALCVTCPLAGKLALFGEAPMEFEEVEITTQREPYFQQADDEEALEKLQFFRLQREGITILQDRGLSLPERIVRLEAFLIRAEDWIAAGRGDRIAELAADPALPHEAGGFSGRLPLVLQLLSYLLDKSEDDDPKSGAFLRRISEALLPEEGGAESPRERWEACYAAYEKEVLGKWGHVLENYLVNEYFSAMYPCATLGNFHHNMRIFSALYCLLELYLLCLLREKGAMGQEDLLEAIRWLAVRVKHYVGYIGLISAFLEEHGEEFL